MKLVAHSHQNALAVFPKKEREDIEAAITNCQVAPAKGAAPKIRELIVNHLAHNGWPGEFPVEPNSSKITIASVKNGIGLCVQTGGNMARMYADLLKLQTLYMDDQVSVGAIIMPTSPASRLLGENIANSDRLLSELAIFKKVIHMPIAIFSFQ
ncbi:MAG: hypothetical protein NTW90_07725 [Nitrosospira sp.]|nr:hypothetical protein [Nitrosospira sp.]